MSFFDKYGNILPNNNQPTSENPSTFNAAYFFSIRLRSAVFGFKLHYDSFVNKYNTNGATWRTMEYDENPDWSLDEKISTCAFFSYTNYDYWLKKVPLFTKDISHYRPDVFLYVLGSTVKWLRPLLYPFIKLKMKGSMKEFYADEVDQSSGAQLAFIKAMGWGDLEFISEHDWKAVFASYYPQADHPIRRLWNSNN